MKSWYFLAGHKNTHNQLVNRQTGPNTWHLHTMAWWKVFLLSGLLKGSSLFSLIPNNSHRGLNTDNHQLYIPDKDFCLSESGLKAVTCHQALVTISDVIKLSHWNDMVIICNSVCGEWIAFCSLCGFYLHPMWPTFGFFWRHWDHRTLFWYQETSCQKA